MRRLFAGPHSTIRQLLIVLAAFQVAGCSSPEERAQRYYENGAKLFSEHDNAKASIELRNAVRLKKDMVEAWKLLAQLDEANRNWAGLATDLRALVEITPKDVSAKVKLGKLLLLAGSANEALRLADAGLQLDDRNAELHALKAATSLKLNDHQEATHEAQTALELDPTNADALMVLAVDRLGSGDAKGALSLLQAPRVSQAIGQENNIGLLLLKIRLFGTTGDSKSAEAALKKLIETNPQQPGFLKLLIGFYLEQGRPDDAERELRNSAKSHPTDSQAALDLVQFLYTVRKSASAAQEELNTRINAGGDVFPYQMAAADLDFAEGKPADGRQLLERLISANSSTEHVRAAKIKLAQTYLNQRNFDATEKIASEVLRDDPHNVSALKVRASVGLERAQLDHAIADLNDALNSEPRSIDVKLLLAKAYERSGLIELADKELADATKASNLDEKIGLEYAAFLQRRGSASRAEDILVRLNKQWANNISVLSALATVRLARQDWQGAEDIAQSIRRINSSVSGGVADQIHGMALVGRNKYDEAITAFQSSYNADPSAAQPMDSLVGTLLKANRKDQAISFLESVLTKNPGSANALVLLGSIQLSNGAADEARNRFLSAVKAQPKDIVGYRALADLYITRKNYDEAIKVVRSGIKQRPDAMSLHMILASIFERKADFEAAISEYQSLLDQEPNNLVAANNLASLLLDRRTDSASLKKAQSLAILLRKSEIPQFKDTLGWASYQQGDYRTAVFLAEQAAAALPDQAAIQYHLGMSYIATGQLTKASEQLKKALPLTSDVQLEEQIRSALKKAGS
jgi:tetratricopeptide (TPR) repeat protein